MRAFSFANVLNKASHAAIATAVATGAALSGTIATSTAAANPLGANSPVVESNNALGFRLMQESLKAEKTAKNVLVSPISAHYALSMALNGTDGKTRTQFIETLGYEALSDISGINKENLGLLKALTKEPLTDAQRKALPAWEKLPAVVSIQNSIWATSGETTKMPYTFKKSFVSSMKAGYGVQEAKSLDFKDPKSADVVNKWTSDMTNKMIPEIIDADGMKDLLWILLNTTYIEAQWATPFGKPFEDEFTKLDGKKAKAQMIHRNKAARFADLPDYQVAEIEMAKSSLRAFVVLPKNASDFEKLQADGTAGIWTKATWSEIMTSLKPQMGKLTMPKFTFEYGVEMKEDGKVTKGLGVNFLFKNSANFDEMDGPGSPPSKVGIIKQNTKIEWDENGVKAAAATLVGGVARGMAPRPSYEMVVDRPFYIAIQDSETGAFLFLGQVIDPK